MPKILSIQNGNEILNNIFYLIETKGIRQKDLADYLGISQNAITQWKTRKTSSYMKYIDKLANYLCVTSEELLNPKKSTVHASMLSTEEMQIIHNFRSLKNNDTKRLFSTLLQTFVENQVSEN